MKPNKSAGDGLLAAFNAGSWERGEKPERARLRDCEDACGHGMLDFHLGKGSYEIVERDDGHVDVTGGPATYFAHYRDWPAHMRKAMKYVRGRVLDTGCGAGSTRCTYRRKGSGSWV